MLIMLRNLILLVLASVIGSASACAQPTFALHHGWPTFESGIGSALDIRVDDRWLLADGKSAPATSLSSAATATVYHTRAGTITDTWSRYLAFKNCWRRTVTFRNSTSSREDLDGVELRLKEASVKGSHSWQCQSFAMSECVPGKQTACTAFTSDDDFYSTNLSSEGLVTHSVHAAWRLNPEQSATIGTQYIWVVPAGMEAARRSAQDWYDAVGLTVAASSTPNIGDLSLYQACAGGSVDSGFSDTGGFAPFSKQLDYIHDLGFNAIWLMSVLKHKDPVSPKSGWNLYDPVDYRQIDPAYGGEAGLTDLVTQMRSRGFRIISELVPSGGHADVCVQHADWHTYDRDGSRSQGFGQGLDYSSPGWEQYCKETIAWMASRWRFDGWRVDVADGYGVNWTESHYPHVSASTMGGSLGMLKAIREGHLKSGAAPIILPESITNRPEQARWGQLGYGFDLIFHLEGIHPAGLAPAELQKDLTEYFERERLSLPRGMQSIRTLNNHDSIVSWGRADRRFGVGLQRALTAVCAVVPGVPMIYQEQEVGSYTYFRNLFQSRKRVPEMRRGDANYLSVRAKPQWFTVLRSIGSGANVSRAIGVVNLSPQASTGDIVLPSSMSPNSLFFDAVTDHPFKANGRTLHIHLPSYGFAILRIGARPEGTILAERFSTLTLSDVIGSSRIKRDDRTLIFGNGADEAIEFATKELKGILASPGFMLTYQKNTDSSLHVDISGPVSTDSRGPELNLDGVHRWQVNTITGEYDDLVLRRHNPWSEKLYRWTPNDVWGYEPYHLYNGSLPAGRQWQSAVAPLTPGNGAITFEGTGGTGLRLTNIKSNCVNLVLTDKSEIPGCAPSRLTLAFLPSDPMLNPEWQPGYRNDWDERPNPWTPPLPQRLVLSFTMTAATRSELRRQLDPVPISSLSARMSIGDGQKHQDDRIWLIDPNEVNWQNLNLSADGTWDVWLQLRHSERGPEGRDLCDQYQVFIDGQQHEIKWDRLNVWSTGNGYFGWARIPNIALSKGPHSLRIKTTHTWCALLPRPIISRDPKFKP